MIRLGRVAQRQSLSRRAGSSASTPHAPAKVHQTLGWVAKVSARRTAQPRWLAASRLRCPRRCSRRGLANRLAIPTSPDTLLGNGEHSSCVQKNQFIRQLQCKTPAQSRQKRDLHDVCLDRRETTGYRLPYTRERDGRRSVWNQYDPIRLSVACPIRVFGHTADVWLPKPAQLRT
jgi:hypothetical protein